MYMLAKSSVRQIRVGKRVKSLQILLPVIYNRFVVLKLFITGKRISVHVAFTDVAKECGCLSVVCTRDQLPRDQLVREQFL